MTTATPPERALGAVPAPQQFPLFPVGTRKFVVLALCTFGIYELYWCYKMWERIGRETGETLSPFWRAFFAPLWAFSLFPTVERLAAKRHIAVMWNAGFLALAYLLLSISWRLPDPWWLISMATFAPFLPVLGTVREINAKAQAYEDTNESFSVANMVWTIIGGSLVVLAVWGTFLPPESTS